MLHFRAWSARVEGEFIAAVRKRVTPMPRRIDHDAQQDLVCDAVVRIALRSGFGAVTIRQVARELTVSTSGVTHYFASRDTLLTQTVRREVGRRRARAEVVVDGKTAGAGLRALAHWSVLDVDDDSQRFWLAMVGAARTEPVLRRELDNFNLWWGRTVRRMIGDSDPRVIDDSDPAASISGDGQLPSGDRMHPALLVDAFDVIVDGLIVAAMEDREPWSVDRRRRTLDALLSFHGW